MYPNFFHRNDKVLPTGSWDKSIQGSWRNDNQEICNPQNDKKCVYNPNKKCLKQVKCSIGGSYFLPNVTRFCASNEAKLMGPTKHNILCQGKSAWDVIKSHHDFANAKQINATNINPRINIARQPDMQVE